MTTEFTLQMQNTGTNDGHMIDCMAMCLINKCNASLCNSSCNLDWMISLLITLPWHLFEHSRCHGQLETVPAKNEQKEKYILFPFLYLEYSFHILPAQSKFHFWTTSTFSKDKNGISSKFSILQPCHRKRKKSSCSVRKTTFISILKDFNPQEKKKKVLHVEKTFKDVWRVSESSI